MLTEMALKSAKPRDKSYKIHDSDGLFIMVSPSGGKLWRVKYRRDGKEGLIALGRYPSVGLKEARKRRDEIKEKLYNGLNPAEERRKDDLRAMAFADLAEIWFDKQKKGWSERSYRSELGRLQCNVLPYLGSRKISEITIQDMLSFLRVLEARGAIETAKKCLSLCRRIMQHAVLSGIIEVNPCRDLVGVLSSPPVRHRAAIITAEGLGRFLQSISSYQGSVVVRTALWLQAMLAVRPGELRHMEWSELDLDQGEWSIPADKMKMREGHLIPLPRQAIDLLTALRPITGHGRYVLPSPRSPKGDRPISENAVLVALRSMGFEKDEVSGHGFRATFRTLADEVLGERVDLIEQQLSHTVRDPLGRAYNRTKFIQQRREMMQRWADFLSGLSTPQ